MGLGAKDEMRSGTKKKEEEEEEEEEQEKIKRHPMTAKGK